MGSDKRILALDYGVKRIGVAVSAPLGFFTQPLAYIPNKNPSQVIEELNHIIKERTISFILLGLPKRTDETIGPEAEKVIEFGKVLETRCGIEVKFYDESYSTKDAEEILINELNLSRKKRKEVIDSMAACLILNSYLRSLKT